MPQGDAADQEARASDRKVFIGGVPFGIDQQQIREDFMQFGDIEDVYLPSDRNTGKLRGFAFVTYREPGTAKGAAQAMHGRDYHGRTITVNLAMLSERSAERLTLQERLASVQQQVAHDEASAREASSPPIKSTESWEQMQSAHAHMLLLEARLAELSAHELPPSKKEPVEVD